MVEFWIRLGLGLQLLGICCWRLLGLLWLVGMYLGLGLGFVCMFCVAELYGLA